jgi:hypothetical protein
MSSEEFYRAFACSHYSPVDCHQEDGVFVLEMACPPEKDRCSGCRSRDVIRRGRHSGRWLLHRWRCRRQSC